MMMVTYFINNSVTTYANYVKLHKYMLNNIMHDIVNTFIKIILDFDRFKHIYVKLDDDAM